MHVRYGREANAASSLFSTIPLVSAFFVGASWLLNQSHDDLGLWGSRHGAFTSDAVSGMDSPKA